MIAAALLVGAALAAPAADLGGHDAPPAARNRSSPEDRSAILEEMWQRRILPPDQSRWSPGDRVLLDKIRHTEREAREYLAARFGGDRPWVARPRRGGISAPARLTKEGYEKYIRLLTQDAIGYFESKGAAAKRVLYLRDQAGRPLFDRHGLITEAGADVYDRARLNREVFWSSPTGESFGTRRPPTQKP